MPLMGSRGGGSVRGFGRFGKVLLLAFLDTFGRTTSGSLGTSSDGKGVWKNVRGTWSANGSGAVNTDTASNNNIAVVDMDGTTITNAQVDVQSAGGGTGVSFWVQDSNNYYALYPSYSTSSQTVTNCGGGGGSGSSLPGNACGVSGSNCGMWYNYCFYAGRVEFTGQSPSCGSIPGSWPGILDTNCGPGWYYNDCRCSSYNWTGTNQTSSLTNYISTVKLLKVQGGSGEEIVSSTYTNNTSGFNRTRSVAISTSGSTVSYYLYSSTNKVGLITSGSSTPSNPVKGAGVGVFRGSSSNEQGTTLSAFSATVTP